MAEEKAKEENPGVTYEDIKTLIVGSKEKVILLNLFTGLINENAKLKQELDKLNIDENNLKTGKSK